MDKLLARPTEAAEAMGISRSKMYQLIATGPPHGVPSVKIGRSVRVPVDELRRWVKAQTANVCGGGDLRVQGELPEAI